MSYFQRIDKKVFEFDSKFYTNFWPRDSASARGPTSSKCRIRLYASDIYTSRWIDTSPYYNGFEIGIWYSQLMHGEIAQF